MNDTNSEEIYKSFGNINLVIGENGSGKKNLLKEILSKNLRFLEQNKIIERRLIYTSNEEFYDNERQFYHRHYWIKDIYNTISNLYCEDNLYNDAFDDRDHYHLYTNLSLLSMEEIDDLQKRLEYLDFNLTNIYIQEYDKNSSLGILLCDKDKRCMKLIDMGHSFIKIFCILVNVYKSFHSHYHDITILIIDEIENGLHPKILKPLFKILIDITYQSKIKIIAITQNEICIEAAHNAYKELNKDYNYDLHVYRISGKNYREKEIIECTKKEIEKIEEIYGVRNSLYEHS